MRKIDLFWRGRSGETIFVVSLARYTREDFEDFCDHAKFRLNKGILNKGKGF